MKTVNTIYTDTDSLKDFCNKNKIPNDDKVLLQIFTGAIDKLYINSLINSIKEILPKINIIGSTTDGEIINDQTKNNSTVLSFSIFENTNIKIYTNEAKSSSYQTAKQLIKKIDNLETAKVAIVFADGLSTNGEVFLKAFHKYAPKLIISGGLAGDNANFTDTFVFTQNGIDDSNTVAAVLYNDNLQVNTSYSFGWKEIGKELTVTKAVENRVYTIDNITATEVYKKYLGSDIEKDLPSTGIEFPLIINRNGNKIARAVIGKNDDGSLVFAGNIKKDDKVYLGYGNIENILNNRFDMYKKISTSPVESIFIYSCMARKRLLGDDIKSELIPLSKASQISGFFTYGEFYSDDKTNRTLFNETMTILTLSETSNSFCKIEDEKNNIKNNIKTTKALSHLISATSQELQKERDRYALVIEGTDDGIWEWNLQTNEVYFSPRWKSMLGYKDEELKNKFSTWEMLVHKDDLEKAKNSLTTYLEKKSGLYHTNFRMKHKDGHYITIEVRGMAKFDSSGNPTLMMGSHHDITEIEQYKTELENINKNLDKRVKEEVEYNRQHELKLMEQAKMVSLGEMIGNIAHQWRQPLSVITSATTAMQLHKEMGILSDEDFQKTCNIINKNTKYLSKTIDTFRDFIKEDKSEHTVVLQTMISKVLLIINPSLKGNHINLLNNINKTNPIKLTLNVGEIEQVIINIINNAKDALVENDIENKNITLGLEKLDHKVIITIEDNAGGIPENVMPKIFEPYFTTKHKSIGTGLGLHMSYKIMNESLKGNLYAKNTNLGAKFFIELPL